MPNTIYFQSDILFTKTLKVMKKSKTLQTYQNKQTNKEMTYFNLIGTEGSKSYHLRCYLKAKFNFVQEGRSYKFQNILQKSDNEFWVIGQSTVAFSSIVETDDTVNIPLLPEDRPAEGITNSLADALKSPEKSTVSGKIVKVCASILN